MKAIEQYFHVVLFIMLYKVVLTFKSVDETLVCDQSNESHSTFMRLYKVILTFKYLDVNLVCDKLSSSALIKCFVVEGCYVNC